MPQRFNPLSPVPLISKNQLIAVVQNLRSRNVLLHHACQLKDFESYLKLGGVPSRRALTAAHVPFTEFQTDRRDQVNSVWDRVFFNFSDFGRVFAQGGAWTPNPYGPIVLKFDPSVLLQADDCCISLRSAGAIKFSPQTDGIAAHRINELFRSMPKNSNEIKTEHELRKVFSGYNVKGNPELNCTIPGGIASFTQLRSVRVDPYEFADGQSLHSLVHEACNLREIHPEVVTRLCTKARNKVYAELRIFAAQGVNKLTEVIGESVGPETKNWAKAALKWDKQSFHFKRYSDYLRRGTVHHVEGGTGVRELRFEVGGTETTMATLEVSPPHFVSRSLTTTYLQERIRDTLEAKLVGRTGRMDSPDGRIDGEITFARVERLRFEVVDGAAECWSCDFVGSVDVRYDGLLADGSDTTDDISGTVAGRVTLTFPDQRSEDCEEWADAISIDEIDLDNWPSA